MSMENKKTHLTSFKSSWIPSFNSIQLQENQKVIFLKSSISTQELQADQTVVPKLNIAGNKLFKKPHLFTPRKEASKGKNYDNNFFTTRSKNSGHFRAKSNQSQTKTLWSTARSFSKSIIQTQSPLSHFHIIKKLGKGSFGQVHLAMEKTTTMLFAIKSISKIETKQKNIQQQVFNELKISLFSQHPNIVKTYGIFDDERNIYMIEEYLFEGSLYNKNIKKGIPEDKIPVLVRQVCEALNYLHEANIFHRDVKLQNILIANDIAKLCDFGCSAFGLDFRKTQTGSPSYFSPQQLKLQIYSNKIDVWSLGVVTFELFFGKAPYDRQIAQIIYKQTQDKQLPQVQFPRQIPQDAKDFIKKTLNKNYFQRLSAKQALFHPFLRTAIHNRMIFE